MIAFHSKEWERVAATLIGLPRPAWDSLCADCFPDLPAWAIGPALVIAKINNVAISRSDKDKTTYYISLDREHKVEVYHREEDNA